MKIWHKIIIFMICLSFLGRGGEVSALIKAFDVDVNGSVRTSYDDNVTSASTNEKDDFITTVLVGLGLKKTGKTYDLELTTNITEQLFWDNTDFNNNAQDVRLAVLKEFSKYDRVSFSNTFRHAEDPSSFEDAFGRTAGRYSFHRNSMNLQYSRDLSKQLGLLVGYDNEIYEVDRANSSDSFLNRVSVELDYFRSSATVFILAYYFSVRDLDPGTNSTVHSFVTGVRHYLTKQLYVDATTGLSLVEDFSGKTSTDPRIFLTLTDDIDENTSVSVSFQKEKFPNGYTEDVFDYWQLTARVRHQLVERMGVVFSGFYGDGDFDSLNIRDKLTGVSTRLNYDLTEHVSAYVDYAYSQTQSNVDARGYERNIITVGMNCSF
ncbi:MAG: outer membrane beta-barrel protein [Candidatus Omnitrophica bacterium]|nr:outer membrane beta-barrel protein [Candidatus Omnitrophota bacterium]